MSFLHVWVLEGHNGWDDSLGTLLSVHMTQVGAHGAAVDHAQNTQGACLDIEMKGEGFVTLLCMDNKSCRYELRRHPLQP